MLHHSQNIVAKQSEMYKAIQEDAPCWIEDANEKRIVPFDTTEVIYNGCPTTMYLISSRPNQVGHRSLVGSYYR